MTTTFRSLLVASVLHLSRRFMAVLLPLFLILGLASSPAALSNTLGLVISADNANEVYLNGVLLGTGNNWTQSKSYSAALQSGTNVLAVKGIDTGGVAAMIAELTLPTGKVVSDATWKVTATAPAGWEAMNFNDSAWPAATQYGQYGVGPWSKNVAGFPASSTAKWIWTADNNNDDIVYFRYTFSVGSAPLAVSTTTLPNGVQGTAYSQTLAATGGTLPYTWSVVTGSLPAGLSLNAATGVISGTPSTSSASNFTVRVTDTNSATAERALALTVTNAPPATLGLVISADNANEVYLNGVLLGTGNNWTQSKSYSAALQSGTNVLAVKGIDTGGVAAMIAELTLPTGKVVSDATWKVTATAPAGWEALGFNDSAWPAATQYGQYGVGPWSKNVAGFPASSTAKWIWTADNNNDDLAYFRYTFSVGSAPPPNVPPTVSLTAPANGASYIAPASINLTANASDSDGSISQVAFYNGASLIGNGTLTGSSYSFAWTNVAAGSYSLTAKATDNAGAVTTSTAVNISVTSPPPPPPSVSLYYLYADHLNTPRVATDSTNKVVWRWDSDAFGTSTANEDPDGDGIKFTYNPRFPGQYFDKETGLHYNYFRDYEPSTGRYVQSDPIGLAGGLNTYGYVGGDPLSYVDPLGLMGWGTGKGPWVKTRAASHSFGVGASFHAALVGLGAGFGATADSDGTWCIYANGSTTFGLGVFAGVGFNYGVEQGSNQTGLSSNEGVFLEGGGGLAEGVEVNYGKDGIGAGKGFAGFGVGGAGGFRSTGTAKYCFGKPKEAQSCKK